MTAVTARRAARSGWLEFLTRTGFVGYGILHLAIAWLALEIVGHKPARADQSGAFELLGRGAFGHVLLIAIAVGLAAMALWQLLLAIIGVYPGNHPGFERVASIGRVAVYGFLLWTDLQVLSNPATSSAASQKSATAGVLAHTGGRLLVALAGLVVLGIGIGMIWYGAKKKFAAKLALGTVAPQTRRQVLRLGQFGYIARGVAFGIVGLLLMRGALAANAARSGGLDGALRTLAAQPAGTVLLAAVAIGFAAFGVYCFFQARYRKV
jgi:hypothetical protein